MSRPDPARELARALVETLTSPNVLDANAEPANLVDTMHRIGVELGFIADALNRLAEAVERRENDAAAAGRRVC